MVSRVTWGLAKIKARMVARQQRSNRISKMIARFKNTRRKSGFTGATCRKENSTDPLKRSQNTHRKRISLPLADSDTNRALSRKMLENSCRDHL